MGGRVITNYNGKDFSKEEIEKFAKGYGRLVFEQAITDYVGSKFDLSKKSGRVGASNAKLISKIPPDIIIDNMGKGEQKVNLKMDQTLEEAAEKLIECIEYEFFNSQYEPTFETPDRPNVIVDHANNTLIIKYGAKYLRRPSLMAADKSRRRIGKGLKDIYAYLANGVSANPKMVVGYWTTSTRRFATKKLGGEDAGVNTRLVVGNLRKREGSDFVVRGVNRFFETEEKNIPYVRIIIPRSWSPGSKTVFYNYDELY